MNPAWPEVWVAATPGAAEQLEQWLFASGALSVSYNDEQDQPILEPAPGEVRLWEKLVIKALFNQGTDLDEIDTALKLTAAALNLPLPTYTHRGLNDAVWERTWMDDFKPMQFGENLWICPSHCEPVDPAAHTIVLDPGLAFGTGTHPTTAQCLSWLGSDSSSPLPLKGRTVLDYGCGSGVLAIAAAKLGASEVWAVDIDPQAATATKANAARNNIQTTLHVGDPGIVQDLQIDLLLANILFEPLMALEQDFAHYVNEGGTLVMSGLLEDQISALCMRYNKHFVFNEPQAVEGWALLVATRSVKS